MKKNMFFFALTIFAVVLSLAGGVQAATCVSSGAYIPFDIFWGMALIWDCAHVPTVSDDAFLDSVPIIIDVTSTAASLQWVTPLTGTRQLSISPGKSLTVSGTGRRKISEAGIVS